MSGDARTTCPHGIDDYTYCMQCDADEHREELRIGQFDAAFPGVRQKDVERKERRAEWIRTHVMQLFSSPEFEFVGEAVKGAEAMADELIKRGYL